MNLIYFETTTSAGTFTVILNQDDIALASGFEPAKNLIKRLPKNISIHSLKQQDNHPYELLVQQYFRGNLKSLSNIPYKTFGTSFQHKVWLTMAKIPYSQTVSYKTLAKNAGFPSAIRAAASACGKNCLAVLIPCHRIIKSDGTIGNYLYGTAAKKMLLSLEQS